MGKTIRPTYKVEEVVLDLADLAKIKPDKNRRKVRPSVVKAIQEQMEHGKHFESAICVNRRGNDCYLFDGHHRYDAMVKYLADHKDDKIKVTFHVYDNLSDQQVKEEYTIVNKGTKQNTNDVVRQHQDDIPVFVKMRKGWRDEKGMLKQFAVPVTAYPTPESISFYRLAGAHMAAIDSNWSGGYMGSAFDFVDDAKELGMEDLKMMHAFMLDFKMAFGPLKNNEFLRSTPFTALYKIWVDNKSMIPPHVMASRWKQKLKGDSQAHELGKSGGSGATMVCKQMYVTLLNANRQRYLFR